MDSEKSSTNDNSDFFGVAKEIFVKMSNEYRISRNTRAQWFFENINKSVQIDDDKNDKSKMFKIVGIIPEGNYDENDDLRGKIFTISPSTKMSYLSEVYRQVFILDMSPSSNVLIDQRGNVMNDRIIPAMKTCLINIMKPFKLPGTDSMFQPIINVTVTIFNPFLSLPSDQVLVQGILISNENDLIRLFNVIEKKIKKLSEEQYNHGSNFVSTFQRQREKLVAKAKESAVREVQEDVNVALNPLLKKYRQFKGKEYDEWKINNFSYGKELKNNRKKEPSVFQEKDYLKSSWSLLFMLRLGLLGANMLTGNSSSNMIIITDGVCGVPDMAAVQNVLRKLRSASISCSFILIKGKEELDPSFGHTTHFETLQFFAAATFGTFLHDAEIEIIEGTKKNYFHSGLLVWSFQRAVQTVFVAEQLVKKFNPKFLNYKHNYEFLHRCLLNHYRNKSLNLLIFVRSREGFTIKDVEIEKHSYHFQDFSKKNLSEECDVITITMCQPWKPEITIEYVITAPWYGTLNKIVDITVEVFIRAPFDFVIGLISNECTGHKRYRGKLSTYQSFNNAIQDIITSDKLLFRINTFNKKKLYEIPEEIDSQNLFVQKSILIKSCVGNTIFNDSNNNTFLNYWKLVSEVDDSVWQSWMHIYRIRVILRYDINIPGNLFVKKEGEPVFDSVKANNALNVLTNFFKNNASLTLIEKQSYVFFDVFINQKTKNEEKYFYLIKFTGECPHLLVNVAFLGCTPGYIRQKNVNELKEKLQNLTIDVESQMLKEYEKRWITINIVCDEKDDCYDIDTVINLFKEAIEYNKKPQLLRIEYTPLYERNLNRPPWSPIDFRAQEDTSLGKYKFLVDDSPILTMKFPILEIIHKPTEKMLVKYNNLPNFFEVQNSEDDLCINKFRSENILNKTILKYLCCRKYIYRISSPHHRIQSMNKKNIEFMLQTILYQKLNQEFSIAYGNGGVVNVIRQAYKMNKDNFSLHPRVQQIVIKTPENFKNVTEKEIFFKNDDSPNTNDNKCYKIIKKNTTEMKHFDFQLTLEVWSEPDDFIEKELSITNNVFDDNNIKKEISPFKLLDEADDIITSLLTIDLVLNSVKKHIFSFEKPLQIKKCNKIEEKGEIKKNEDQYMKIFTDCYDIEKLCQFAPEKMVTLYPIQYCKEKNDDIEDRFRNLFFSFHNELSNDFHGCIREEGIECWENEFDEIKSNIKMENEKNCILFENKLKLKPKLKKKEVSEKEYIDKEVEEKSNGQKNISLIDNEPNVLPVKSYMRYYVKQLTYTSVVIVSLPERFEDILKMNNYTITKYSTIPICAYFIDETFLASSLSQSIPLLDSCPLLDLRWGKIKEEKIEKLQECVNQYRDKIRDNTIVFNICNPRGGYNKSSAYNLKFNFLEFSMDLDEVVFTRTFIGAAFKTICEMKYVPDYIIKEMIDEKCHVVRKELSTFDDKLKSFCKHYNKQSKDENFDNDKCYDNNNEFCRQFKIILDSHNFTKTRCLKDYFIYNAILRNCNEIMNDIRKNGTCDKKDSYLKNNYDVSNKKKDKNSSSSNSILFDNNDDKNENKVMLGNTNDNNYDDSDENSTFNGIECISHEPLKESQPELNERTNSTSSMEYLKDEVTAIISRLDVLTPPLFIHFICALLIPGEEMITFPIVSFPNCILDVLEECPIKLNINKLKEMLDKIKVSIDMYIVTKPKREIIEIQRRNKLIVPSVPISIYKKHNLPQRGGYLDFFDMSSSDDEEDIFSGRNEWMEIDPSSVKIIKKFFSDINYLVNAEEYFLMLKNKSKVYGREELERVCEFVEMLSRNETNLENERYKYVNESIKMIGEDNEVYNCIRENLANLTLDYIKLKKCNDCNEDESLFYSCDIINKEKFMRNLVGNRKISLNECLWSPKMSGDKINDVYMETYDESSRRELSYSSLLNDTYNDEELNSALFSSEDESQIDTLYTDYWIVIYLTKKQLKIMLIQRNPETHNKLFFNLVKLVKEIILKNNQKRLLNEMYESKKVDGRLLKIHSTSSAYLGHPNAGLYACNIVSFHYFFIHYRLRIIHTCKRGNNRDINHGLDVLENCLSKYECDDSRVFVYKENNGNVIFMKFLLSDDVIDTNNDVSKDVLLLNHEDTRDKILLAIYGYQKPGKDSMKQIVDTLSASLRDVTLQELAKAIYESKYLLPLNPEDIKYLQPDFKNPDYTFCYALPHETTQFIYSLNYFLLQHLELFINQPYYGKTEYLTFCHHLPRKFSHDLYTLNIQDIFLEWINPYDKEHDKTDMLSNFYYVNRYSPSGRFSPGIAVIELRLLHGETKKSVKLSELYNVHIFDIKKENVEMCRKNIKHDEESLRRISQYTFSNDISNLNLSTTPYIVQFNIWERGDAAIDRIKIKLDHCVQQSIFDMYTECIFLQKPCFEGNLMYQSSPDLSDYDYNDVNQPFIREKSKTIAVPKRILNKQQSLMPQTLFNTNEYNNIKNIKSQSLQDLKNIPHYDNVNLFGKEITHHLNGAKINVNSEINSESGGTEGFSNKSIFADVDVDEREYVDMDFLLGLISWFDYVNEANNGYDKSKSYRKLEMFVDSCIAIDTSYEIIAKKIFETNPPEDLVLSQAVYGRNDERRKQAKLRVIENDLEPISKYSCFIKKGEEHKQPISHAAMLFDFKMQKEISEFIYCLKGKLPRRIAYNHSSNASYKEKRFPSSLCPFVSRQRILLIIIRGNLVTYYFYNFSVDITDILIKSFTRTLHWHDAKAKLNNEIQLQKLGYFHAIQTRTEETAKNSYELFITYDPYVLIEYDYPPADLGLINYSQYPRAFMRGIRLMYRQNFLLDIRPTSKCSHAQVNQYLELRCQLSEKMLGATKAYEFYENIFRGVRTVPKEIFDDALNEYTRIHFVNTPILLFEEWRNQISNARVPPSKAKTTIKLNNYGQPEMYVLKIQYMMIKEFAQYFNQLGWENLTLEDKDKITTKIKSNQSLEYSSNCKEAPNIWMTQVMKCGVLLANIYFKKPYLCVHLYSWELNHFYNNMKGLYMNNDIYNYEDVMMFENVKDNAVSLFHLHSFSYDYHLRVAWMYMLSKENLIFPNDYNIPLFLFNLLKYYEYRPPYSRNALYEIIIENKNLKIQPDCVWEKFLDDKQKTSKMVVRFQRNDYMIVEEQSIPINNQMYKVITVMLRAPVKYCPKSQLNIRVFKLLINAEEKFPIITDLSGEEEYYGVDDEIEDEDFGAAVVKFKFPCKEDIEEESSSNEEEIIFSDTERVGEHFNDYLQKNIIHEVCTIEKLYTSPYINNCQTSIENNDGWDDDSETNCFGLKLSIDLVNACQNQENIPPSILNDSDNSGDDSILSETNDIFDFLFEEDIYEVGVCPQIDQDDTKNEELIDDNLLANHKTIKITSDVASISHSLSSNQQLVQKILGKLGEEEINKIVKDTNDCELNIRRQRFWELIARKRFLPKKNKLKGIFREKSMEFIFPQKIGELRDILNRRLMSDEVEELYVVIYKKDERECLDNIDTIYNMSKIMQEKVYNNFFKFIKTQYNKDRTRFIHGTKNAHFIYIPNDDDDFGISYTLNNNKSIKLWIISKKEIKLSCFKLEEKAFIDRCKALFNDALELLLKYRYEYKIDGR
uniref:VWFA domain-containing protein n=1 Tax=Parastrongyloides trichosuri TaxID=131310 RepID=A0A0N4Z3W4_PARTI